MYHRKQELDFLHVNLEDEATKLREQVKQIAEKSQKSLNGNGSTNGQSDPRQNGLNR